MKRFVKLLMIIGCLLVVWTGYLTDTTAQTGEGYDLTWFSVAGGGGHSFTIDSEYTLVGSIGQADAGWLSDGDGEYTLGGGFLFSDVAGNSPQSYFVYLPVLLK